MSNNDVLPVWTIDQLREHLQAAVDLEFWTIPFYMSAMYSIVDPGTEAYGTLLSVVNQEMLHVQLAANVANAYGLKPSFATPVYYGQHIPHLDFDLDDPDPRVTFGDYSAEIGPFDRARLNAMCLIEYPLWLGTEKPHLQPDQTRYGSIAAFYRAVGIGAAELQALIEPANQVNAFARFYQNFGQMTVTATGSAGLPQVQRLIEAICEQGEGVGGKSDYLETHQVPKSYRNTADDSDPNWSHFQKFISLWSGDHFPETYPAVAHPPAGSAGHKAQQILEENFTGFLTGLDQLFSGGDHHAFMTHMFTLGGNILNCWKHGAIPRFGADFAHVQHGLKAEARRVFPSRPRLMAPIRPIKTAKAAAEA